MDPGREATLGPGTQHADGSIAMMQIMRLVLSSLGAPQPPPHPDDLGRLEISRKDRGFIGKSSGISLINAAINLKADVKRKQHSHSQSPEQSADDHDSAVPAWPSRRLEYWRWRPWATIERHTKTYDFQSEAQLIGLYFIHQKIYLPLLHRPTFALSRKACI
ncbi:hypothetical protein B0H13DRAFT_2451607 [Mycena leptocephala]|nr:hypothetical protein B0H13DRAFT_2451607 [Mycena leptocephala]